MKSFDQVAADVTALGEKEPWAWDVAFDNGDAVLVVGGDFFEDAIEDADELGVEYDRIFRV